MSADFVCPHGAWEERNGGWCKCSDCGYGWSAPKATQPPQPVAQEVVEALERCELGSIGFDDFKTICTALRNFIRERTGQ